MKIAVIGGSVLSQIASFDLDANIKQLSLSTDFGQPSSTFLISSVAGNEVVYLNRHGNGHTLAPHRINYRANIAALKQLDVSHIIASAAVGGISAAMSPLQCVLPDQLIDYTWGREHTFNMTEDDSVQHIDFSYPFDDGLRQQLLQSAQHHNISCEMNATYGVTQGPRLETVAEIQRLENDGCDIVGMTAMPEAALAREMGMAYVTCAVVVNRAAGKQSGESDQPSTLSMTDIMASVKQGDELLQKMVNTFLKETYY